MLPSIVIVSLMTFTALASADDNAPLSAGTYNLISPIVDDDAQLFLADTKAKAASKNDLMAVLQYQTKVKSQGQRNTCTIFAITGLLESLLLTNNTSLKTIDLSEQWVQYLVALRSPSGGANGSTVPINFAQIQKYGIAEDAFLKYNETLWTDKTSQAQKTCTKLTALNLTRCLMSQMHPSLMTAKDTDLLDTKNALYNPEFVKARASASYQKKNFAAKMDGYIVGSTSSIKSRLRDGLPLTLEINIFYGSWNHSHGNSIGIDTDVSLFKKGIITYPERKSMDFTKSPTAPARHAVVIVGYDDDVEVTYTKNMTDGTIKTFTRKGVYYFKNSWGTKKFGSQFKVEGKTVPGFGMIVQDYANEFGQFYAIDLATGTAI